MSHSSSVPACGFAGGMRAGTANGAGSQATSIRHVRTAVRLAGKIPVRGEPGALFLLELRRPLLDEGLHALFLILGGKQALERSPLKAQAF